MYICIFVYLYICLNTYYPYLCHNNFQVIQSGYFDHINRSKQSLEEMKIISLKKVEDFLNKVKRKFIEVVYFAD